MGDPAATRNDVGMAFSASDSRYDSMIYRRTGRSGLDLPAISLGLWHNFGDDMPFDRQRAILRRAFDLGITHFDLANNYGPPYGSAETNFGRHLADDFAPYRDELVISTKAGYDMWPGPYGQGGGSRKYLLSSLDQSLKRMRLDYVDIFYSHRPDPTTPLEETMGALDAAVRAGKALYAGISSYSPQDTKKAAAILADLGTPLLIHQPSYSMINRWIEREHLLDTLEEVGAGCIAFSPLAQGMLTSKYLDGVPEGSRASQDKSLSTELLSDEALGHIRDAERHRADPRAEPGPDGAGLGAARPPDDVGDHRGQQRRSARAERRGAGQPVVQRRRAVVHRRARRRHRRRPVGGPPHRVSRTAQGLRALADGEGTRVGSGG